MVKRLLNKIAGEAAQPDAGRETTPAAKQGDVVI